MKDLQFFYFILILSFNNCTFKSLPIEEELVNKCLNAHGGLDKWKSLTSTEYSKNIILYTKEGEVEKKIRQTHHYSTVPNLSGTIDWADSLKRKIIYEDGIAFKINGNQIDAPSQSALNTFNSAYYVLNMPWKFLDASAQISYQGIDTILENKIVHTLKIEYPSENQKDVWEYYLDNKEYYLVANRVHHGSTYSLITNDDYVWYKGLRFNSKRTSYMVDSLGEILYVRAKYEYKFKR